MSNFLFKSKSQVTSLLRRVLPEVTPVRLASIIGVKALPPADISDIIHSTEKGDWNKLCILDMFLGCIAKALTVQLKAKGTTISGTAGMAVGKGVTTVTLPMIFNSRWVSCDHTSYTWWHFLFGLNIFFRNEWDFSFFPLILSYIRRGESHWWMKGSTPPQIAEIIIKLVKDMAAVSHYLYFYVLLTKRLQVCVLFSILFFVLGASFRRLVQSHQKCNSWNYHSPYQNGGRASVSCTVYCHHKGMDSNIKKKHTLKSYSNWGSHWHQTLFSQLYFLLPDSCGWH